MKKTKAPALRIRVSFYADTNTYTATATDGTSRLSASAPAGSQSAVARLARQVFPDTIPFIALLSSNPDGSETWSATA